MKKLVPVLMMIGFVLNGFAQNGLFTFKEITYITPKQTKKKFFFKKWNPAPITEEISINQNEDLAYLKQDIPTAKGNVVLETQQRDTIKKVVEKPIVERWFSPNRKYVGITVSKDTLLVNLPLHPDTTNIFYSKFERDYGKKISAWIESEKCETASIVRCEICKQLNRVAYIGGINDSIKQIAFALLVKDCAFLFEDSLPTKSVEGERFINYHETDDPNVDSTFFVVLRNRQKVSFFSTNFELGIPVIPIKYRPRKFEEFVTNGAGQSVPNLTDRYEFAFNGNIYLGARLGRTTYLYNKHSGMKSYNYSGYIGAFAGFGSFALKTNNIPEADSATLTRFNKDLFSAVFNTGFTFGFDFRGFQTGMYLGWDIPLNPDYRKVWYYRDNNFFIGFGVGYAIGLLKGKS